MNIFQSAYCLICHEIIRAETGWKMLFSVEREQHLCTACEEKLEKIEGEVCKICGRPFRLLEEIYRHSDLCHDCQRWEDDPDWAGFLQQNTSLYLYNEFLREVLARYKFRGDYVISKAFSQGLKDYLHKKESCHLVPIPLSKERLYERGFNQAEALILEAGFKPKKILTRVHSEKQSKKSRVERIHIPQVFELEDYTEIQGNNIVLIDDIYTTGSTLRHAAKLLKNAGAKSITSFTLAR